MSKFILNYGTQKKSENYEKTLNENKIFFAEQIKQSKGIPMFRNIFIFICVLVMISFYILGIFSDHFNPYWFIMKKENVTILSFLLSNLTHVHFLHLALNMSAAFILFNRFFFADLNKLIVLVIISGLFSSIFSLILMPEKVGVLGASGILYGVLSFYMLYIYELKLKFKEEFSVKNLNKFLLIQGGFCVIISFLPGLAWFAHLGGAIAGVLVYFFYRKDLDYSYESFVLTYHRI